MKIFIGLNIFLLFIFINISGYAQPVISANPTFFSATLGCNDSITQNLTINNTGSSTLSFSTFFKYAYVCNSDDNTVSVIDVTTNTIIGAPIPVGQWPMQAAISPDAQYVYVSSRDEYSVYVIQTSSNTVVDTIVVGYGSHGLAFTPDGNFLYVCNQYDNTVSVVECSNNTVISTIYDTGLNDPFGVAVSPDGKKVYVASRNSGITVIDVITNTVITNISGFIRPLGIVFTPDGKYAFISEAASSGSVVQVDVSTNTIIKKIGIFDQAVGIDLTPDGKYIYAVDKGIGSVQIIEVSSGNVVDTISNSLLIGGWGLAISPDGRYAYIGITWNNPSLIILDINNKTVAGSLVTSINGSWGVTTLNNIPVWLTSGIISDTISAGNSTNIGLKFKSTGINTGIYSYDLYVFSNDSVNPSVIIPCTLTIDGPPSMALSDTCLNFDTTYVTGYQDKILKIFNNGCDTLKVTGLSPSAQFTVSSSNLIVMPYDSTIVTVRFSPVVTGNITGSLAITSNDYNTSVCLNGTGKLPPDISVSPSSLSATAIGCVGDTITKLLKIYNTGFDNLDCNITMDQGSYDSTSFIQYFISDATTTHIFPFSLNPDSINIRVIINGDYDSGSESANLYIDGTLIETIPDGNLLETDIIRNYAFGGSQLDNWLIDNQIIVTIDNTSGVGAFGSTDYHSVQLWYNGVQWPGMINPIPNQVNIIPGDSATISVDFISTGKNTGVYSTYLFVVSNDPDSPVDTIPCTLTVIGNPEISVSDTCLNFTSTQLGLSSTDTILITNTGCDTLFITAISAAPAVFTFNPVSLPLTVQPGTFITIPVIFTPANAQVYSGNLSISSNAGNKDICLNGTGLPSAIINLIPDSFNVTLTGCNDSITLPLGIYNSGNANLNYTIDISGTQPPTGYCIPIYTYCCPEGCGDGDYIRNFTFNTISNLNSNCNGQANGYIYYSSLTTKVQPGNTYNISMQAGSFGEGFGVWIDYNRDGDFIDAGEFVYASPSSGTGLFSGTVTIPANAATGKTRLRVRCAYSTIIGASAYCSSYTYGETEDYDITIGDIFVSCNPASGTSLPPDTSIVDVKFKSYGLAAGFHYGIITINSDDPINPSVNIPCTLNIVGVPDISISSSSLNYGSIFQYASKIDSITINNSGCGNLTISNITNLNPAYSIDSTSLTIAPWSSKKIRITFNPQTIGAHYDTLNVLNNDSNIKIPLYGYALSPPVITYSPSSFNITTANCNDSITLPLTIYNTGDTDLIFSLTGGNIGNFNLDVAIAGSDDANYLNDVRNKLLATGKFNSVTIIDVRNSTPTLATLQQYDAIIVWMNYNYNNPTQLGNVMADYVDNGGGVVSAIFETGYSGHMLGRWDTQEYYVITRGSYTTGYTTLGTVLEPGHPIMKNIVSLNGNGSTYRPNNTALTSTSSLIARWADGKPLVAVKEKNGSRLADLGLWPPSSDIVANSWQSNTNGGLLMANALEWVSEFVSWLAISSDADTIAAGDSVVVNVTFNTSDLITGNYSASLIINSNDPLSSSDTVLCNLTLNGHPTIALSDTCINYSPIMQWANITDSVNISNTGCDTLFVSDITLSNSVFSVNTTNLVIPPDDDVFVYITFSPVTAGIFSDTLRIYNNDVLTEVCINASSYSPPVLAYSPSSFNITTANCNDSITLPLTIYNTGDTDLIFSLTGGNLGNFNIDVAIAGSDNVSYLNDVRNKLLATGKFNSVTIIDVRNSTPTLATLQQYDAIIVWMNYNYNNPTQLGNIMADYVDNGGGVVSAIFETGYSGHMLGRWETQEYYVITRGSYTTGYTTLGTVLEPGHPIMKNIVSLNGNGSTYRPNNTALTSTSSLIARWADGKPLVAVKEKNGSRLADLGLWPPSSDIIGNSWQSNTNGGLLMANALEWVSEFVSWLAISSDADTIAAGDSVVVNVTFNTSDLITGNYSASLIINSNDPLSSSDTVLCNLTLNGHPTIVLSDTCINYNPIMQWTNITDSVNISNTGCDTLFVSDITLSNSVFSVNTTNLVIPPDDDVFVHITFSPVTAGIFSDTLRIYNNDVLTEVCINASSYSPPVLAYFPDSLIATVNICNDSVTLPLTIYNPGDTLLNWNSDIINNFTKSSLNLTGSNYVSVTNFTGLPSGSVMTVEAWVYPVGLPDASYNGVVAFGPRVCTGTSFLLSMTNAGRPSFASWCKDFVPTTGPTATLNQWHHIAAVLNGSSIKLYLDGYEWSGSLGTAPNVQPGTLTIGCTDLPGRYFNGRIDEVRIWNQVRTAQQISDLEGVLLNPNDAGLVSYWNFNEGTGTTVADRTGNGHTGNLIGAGWSLTSPQLSNMYLSTTSGSILAGDSSIVNVTFYTSAIDSGTYYESIIINSNDPLNEADTVPTVLFYNGYPVMTVSDNCLEYDSLFQYLTVTDTLWISNTGCATLSISNISNSLSAFTIDSAIFSILPDNSNRVIVTFNPLSAGHYYDTLHIFNNDSNINICLHGYALSPPVISLNPDSFYVIINNCNDSVTLPLTISNTGDTTLSWNIISQLNSGSALSFNGSNNYVQIPNSNVFDVTRLTMEAWVYSNNFNQNGFIFEKGPVNTQYSMFFEGASFCFRTVNSSGSMHSQYVNSTTLGLTNGNWYHIACTYDGVNKKIYVNGVLKNTLAYNQILRTGMQGQIIGAYGGTGGHSYYLNGRIDEVRVWNYAKTALEISQGFNQSLIGNESGLIGYWNFNEGSGATLYDLTNYNHDGTITGASWVASGASVQDNIQFNTYSGNVTASDSTLVNVTFYRNNQLSGTYYKQIIINSNDPLSPLDTIPCTLVFTNHPVIEVSDNCLEFDSIFQYLSIKDSLWILNSGCDTLKITNITNSLSTFTLNTTVYSIIPGDSAKVVVTFAPLTLGHFYDTLRIFNNDTNINVCLHGFALSPPIITFNPDSINVTISGCNDSLTVPITIYNTGDEDLYFDIGNESGYSATLDGNGDYVSVPDHNLWTFTGDFTISVKVKANSWSGNWWQRAFVSHDNGGGSQNKWIFAYNGSTILHRNDASGSAITVNGNAWVADIGVWYNLTISRSGNTFTFYKDGVFNGSVVNTMTLPDANVPLTIGTAEGGSIFNGLIDEVRIWNYACTQAEIQNTMNKTLTGFEQGLIGYWNFDNLTADDLSFNGNDGTFIGNATTVISNISAQPNWLSYNLVSDTVSSGDSTIINVTFNASNLITGTFHSNIIISSNDPLNSSDTIPCTLIFNGHPVIVITDTCLDFNSIMQWTTKTDTITFSNTGCDTLKITNISHLSSEFDVNTTNLSIFPGNSASIIVTYQPQTAGNHYDTLQILNNDTIVNICLHGYAISPPVIAFDPDSINAVVNVCNDSVVVPLTIYNIGDTTLTYNIAAQTVNGTGYALQFDGVNDYADMGNWFNYQSFTIEMWVKPGSTQKQYADIIDNNHTGSRSWVLQQNSNNTNQYGWGTNDGGGSALFTLTANQWTHIAITRDGSTKINKVYINGSLFSSYTGTSNIPYDGTQFFRLCRWGGGGREWNGTMDEVRVWNTVRSQQQITQNMSYQLSGSETGLLAYWNIETGSGNSISDISGNGRTGTIQNGAIWTTQNAPLENILIVNSNSGSILAGDSNVINFTFYTDDINSGIYYREIVVSSNDPLSPADTIPCTLIYNGYPLISLSDICLNFDSIMQWTNKTDSFYVNNTGCDTLFVTDISNSNPYFQPSLTSFYVLPNDSQKIKITFTPLTSGSFSDTLTIFNDDNNITLCLNGYSISPPVISFNPDSFSVTINNCNDSITLPLTILNTGDTTLTWNIISQLNSGSALSFNGSNNYVLIPNSNVFDVANLTMEAWVFSNNYNQNGFIFEKGPVNTQYSMFFEGASFCFRTYNSGGSVQSFYVNSASIGFTNGSWHHVACTYDGINKKIYVDGTLKSTFAYNQTLRTGMQGQIIGAYGGTGGHSYYLNGRIDEVRVWNHARTALEISQSFNQSLTGNESGLIGYWNFNEGSGATLNDFTNYNHDGTITGASWVVSGASVQDNIQVDSYSGNIVSSDSALVYVTFYRNNQVSGTYYQQIIINSNDPLSPLDTIPCTLIYNENPVISLSDTCLLFDTILQWETDSQNLVIHNTGCDILQITDITSSLSEFSLSDTSFTLAPGDSSVLTVSFNPVTIDTFNNNIILYTNIGTQSVCLNAVSTPPPVISVNPDSMDVTLTVCNDSAVFPFTIYNSGSVALNYSINAILNIAASLNNYIDTIASGDSSVVNLIIDGTTVTSGTYNFPIEINSNDPLNPFVSIPVTFTVTARPTKPVASDTSICDGSAVPDLFAAGTNVNWYNDTSLVFSGNTFTTGDTAIGIYNYYVTQTVDNCESFADTVTLAIYAIPSAPASSDNTICFENTNALLTAAGSNIVWYSDSLLSNQVAIGNNFLTGLTAVGTYTFYLTQTVNNCQSPFDISTLTINPIPAAPVVSDTLICFGNPTPDLITSGENIQWYSDSALQNLIHIGDTLSTGITAAGVYTFYATQTSIAYNCQGHASAATLTIDSLFLPPVVSDNAICYGQATPAFNATGDSLRWYSDSLLFTLVGTGNSYLPSDTMVGSFTYYLTQNNQCGESTPESATLIIHPIPSAPVSSDQSVCFGYNVPDLVATGTNIIWYSDSLLSNTVYSGNTFTTGQFNVGTYLYYITQTINNCESPADIVSLEIRSTPLIPTVSDTVICFGDSTPDLTATGNNVQWYSDNTLSTLIHTGNIFSSGNTASGVYVYYVTDLDTVAGCESFSDSIKLTINAIPAVPVTNDNSICFGQTTPSFTATGSNIIWYSDTNIVNIGNTYTPADTTIGPYTYFVTQTVNNCESPADTVIFTINPLPPAPLVTDSIICTLNPIPDFIAQGTNIRWYADSTLNNLVYTGDTLTPGISLAGTYNWYVTQTISATGCEGPFETATLIIDTLPFAPVADDHTICYGTPTPVFNSTGSNVMWYDSSLTFILFDGNSYPSPDTAVGTYIYYVKQQNHCGQSTPDTAILIINSNPSAPVGTGSSVCFGSLVPPLTASGATVIWYQDSALTLVLDTTDSYNSGMTNVGTYIYYITLSQNNCQGPSDTVILDIRNIPSEPVSNDEVICFGTTTPDLIATGVNVNWYENSALDSVISTGNTFSTGITTAGSYTFYVTQFDNGNSCESFADTVTLTINSIPSPPVTTDTSICFGQSIPLLMAIGSNIIWYSDTNIVNTGSNFTPADTASGTYNFYVTQTVNNCESPADTVIFTINTLPPAPFVSDTVTCSGSSTPDLIAQGLNIQWYNDSLLSTLVYSGDTLSPGVTLSGIYSWYVTQTISATGCEGSYSKVTLTIDSLPFKPIVADQVICFGTVTPSFTAIGTNVKWYSDSALTVIVQTGNNYTSTEDTVGSYVYFVTQSNYCGESSADSAMLTINAIPLPPDASGYSVCFGQPTQTINATGANIIWYLDSALSIPIDTANSYNPNISAQGTYTYYLTQTVNACQSPADTAVIIIHSLPVPPSASDQYTCTSTIPSLIASGSSIQWYDSSGFVYAGDTLVTGQTQYGVYTYYATQTSLATGCESNRDTVLLTISTAIINPPVTNDTASCFGQTVPDLTAQGLNIIWYSDSLLNTQVGTDTVFATGITSPGTYTYWVVQQNICGISPKAEATLTINSLPDTPVSSDTSTCKGNIIALSATGNNLHWYQDITLETLLFTGDNYIPAIYNVPGIYTYYLTDSSFVTGCISNIDSLIFIVKDVPVSPVAENDTACFGGNVPDLTATGTNINWYDDALLTNLVFTGDTFSTGQTNLGVYTYYLTQSNECGASVSDTVVLTISNQPGTPVVSGASVCSGDSSSLSAIGMNINWYSDTALTLLVDTGNYFTPADTAVGTYNWYVTQTNSSTGCISNYSTVSLVINSIPIAPEVTDSTVCQGTANPALTAIGSNITWYNDSALTVIIDTDSIFIPTDIDSGIYNYYTTQTVNSCESPSSLVVFTIKALPASPIATDSSICDGGLIPLFTSSGSNLTWYSDSALTTSIATGSSYQPLVSNPGVYNWYVTQMQNGCEGPYDIATLIINSVPLPPIAVDDTICYGASVPVLNASGANVIWYGNPALTDTLQNGNNYQPTDASAGTHIFYVTQSVNNCISSSNDVIFFVFDSSVPPVASDHSICMGNDASSLTATGVNVQWYSDAALLNLIYSGNTLITNDSLPGTYIYYATQIISTCGISPSDSAILTIKSIPPAPVLNDETICFGNTTPALVATGSDLKWYSEPELIILVNIGTNFNTGNTAVGTYTYYVTQNINGCTSRSNDIVLTINPTPLVTLNKYYANISEGGSVTLIAYNAVNYSWTPVTGLSTATGAVVVASPVQTTTYIVTGTNNQGCFDTAKCVVEVGEISVEENDLAQYLSVYPNPTNRDLKIKFVSLQKESLKIRILNQLGQVLINLQSEQHKGRFEESISLENIADGVYYLQVMADKGVITKKVVLKR